MALSPTPTSICGNHGLSAPANSHRRAGQIKGLAPTVLGMLAGFGALAAFVAVAWPQSTQVRRGRGQDIVAAKWVEQFVADLNRHRRSAGLGSVVIEVDLNRGLQLTPYQSWPLCRSILHRRRHALQGRPEQSRLLGRRRAWPKVVTVASWPEPADSQLRALHRLKEIVQVDCEPVKLIEHEVGAGGRHGNIAADARSRDAGKVPGRDVVNATCRRSTTTNAQKSCACDHRLCDGSHPNRTIISNTRSRKNWPA